MALGLIPLQHQSYGENEVLERAQALVTELGAGEFIERPTEIQVTAWVVFFNIRQLQTRS